MSHASQALPTVEANALTAADTADSRTLRNLFGMFLTGVTVVTAYDRDGRARGFTANSFTAVSLDPPLVLVCLRKEAGSYATFVEAARFGVNILGDWQRDVSTVFASPSTTKFDGVATSTPPGGPPLIDASLSVLDCARHAVAEAGDHAILIGRVLGFRIGSGWPLGYYRGGYVGFEVGTMALEQLGGEAILVGGLIEHAGKLLLWRRPERLYWEIPTIALRPSENHRRALPILLERLGVRAEVSFLYSVFQEKGDPHTTMVFRGDATEAQTESVLPDGTTLRFFGPEEEPWKFVRGSSPAEVLRRYFRERQSARFGIYWDTPDEGGRVAAIDGTPDHWPRPAARQAKRPPRRHSSRRGEGR
jgi:flavin reductase (DIM6/NTAB) family NADH-FMN oxidoreductase RutF